MADIGDGRGRISRRGMLGAMGVGAGAVALGPGQVLGAVNPAGAAEPEAHSFCQAAQAQNFGRIFHELPPFAKASPALRAALLDIGKPGGILDAHDNLAAGPKNLITDPTLSLHNPDNPTHTAGTTFFGQFIDHDITFDASSKLFQPTVPEDTRNFRSPSLDLDSLYGSGFVSDQLMYDTTDRAKLRIESGGVFEDLPRTANGTAIIGDPRNDEHLIVAGLHCAFILFHNHNVDRVRAGGLSDTGDVFAAARRLTVWHYQWLIVHEFLPQIVGAQMVDDVLQHGRRFYRPDSSAYMPVEFQGAAYRFGHSMVRPSYRANLAGDSGQPFFGLIFDPGQEGVADPSDLRGGSRAARRFIGWQTFFDFGDGQVKRNKQIDTNISTPLMNLPIGAIATHDGPTALPQRTLLRQVTWSLPSGQRIAQRMNVPALTSTDLTELAGYGLHLETSTPLWYYALKEAQLVEGGLKLGPVAGRIVAEVIIGLLQLDPSSYLNAGSSWTPTLPSAAGAGQFHITDMLTLAGVSPSARGQ
jgi:hypothetical protein